MPLTDLYPEREAILPHAFALRHMIVEEIKFRKTQTSLSARERGILNRVARGVTVTVAASKHAFEIQLDQHFFQTIPITEWVTYLRGDTPTGVQRQAALTARQSQAPDAILNTNRARAGALVEALSAFVRTLPPPISTTVPFRGISCLIRAHNLRGSLSRAIRALAEALQTETQWGNTFREFEIIIVDDGSTDGTLEDIQALAAELPIKWTRHTAPEGYCAAFYTGLSLAQYDLVFLTEANHEFDYSQLSEVLPHLHTHEAVLGYRLSLQAPLVRRLNVYGWNALVRLLFGQLARDIDCAFKLFQKSALERINPLFFRSQSAIINTELLVRVRQRKLRVIEVPVQAYPRELGTRTGASLNAVVKGLWDMGGLLTRLLFERLGWLGFVTGAFSRTHRPMEMIRYRRSKVLSGDEQIGCRLCGASGDHVRQTHLHTCADLQALGEFKVFYCLACQNGFTHSIPAAPDRLLVPDRPLENWSAWQRYLMDWFLNIRVRRVLHALGDSTPKRILDIGGGNGVFAKALARLGHQVTIIEPNPANQQFVAAFPEINFLPIMFTEDAVRGCLPDETFDAVTLWHSLEHIPNPTETLQLARRLLKPGGCLYICVPNLNSLQADLGSNHWAYLDVPHHVSHFTLDGLVAMLRQANFAQLSVHWFSPEYEVFGFYQTLLNIISQSHNYYYHLAKKRQTSEALRFPRWTRFINRIGWICLPVALLLSVWADAVGKSACVEVHSYKHE